MNVNPKRRTERIIMRVTPEEKKEVVLKAKALGLSVTAFLIMEALGEAATQLIIDGFDKKKR